VLIGRLQSEGISVKTLNVGSTGGLAAAKRGECDIAAIHLMDPETGEYKYRKGAPRFEGRSLEDAIGGAIVGQDCLMVNRNAGSGTRILTDRLLGGAKPAGYWSQPKSHSAVGVAVAQGRADWGIAIETVARQYGLGFIPAQDEHYDFIVPKAPPRPPRGAALSCGARRAGHARRADCARLQDLTPALAVPDRLLARKIQKLRSRNIREILAST
jgi:putative molybdopterin biosynthesis protein